MSCCSSLHQINFDLHGNNFLNNLNMKSCSHCDCPTWLSSGFSGLGTCIPPSIICCASLSLVDRTIWMACDEVTSNGRHPRFGVLWHNLKYNLLAYQNIPPVNTLAEKYLAQVLHWAVIYSYISRYHEVRNLVKISLWWIRTDSPKMVLTENLDISACSAESQWATLLHLRRRVDRLARLFWRCVYVHAGSYRFLNAPLADRYPVIPWYITAQWSTGAQRVFTDGKCWIGCTYVVQHGWQLFAYVTSRFCKDFVYVTRHVLQDFTLCTVFIRIVLNWVKEDNKQISICQQE